MSDMVVSAIGQVSGAPYSSTVAEKAAITQVIGEWAIWRDTAEWGKLRACYASDGTMAVSWADVSVTEFIEGCKRIVDDPEGRIVSNHIMGTSGIDVRGDRAVAESRMTVIMRLKVHGILCDVTGYGRFFDLFLKTSEGWKIQRRVAIFDKDCIAPVNPSDKVELNELKLATFPPAYQFCAYTMAQFNMPLNSDLPAPGSAALVELYKKGAQWLAGN
jgi:hypothetical protein